MNDDFDWEASYKELTANKALWQANNINKYVYQRSSSCFCPSCYRAAKYVTIENDMATHVEFDNEDLEKNNFDCSSKDIQTPIKDNYHSIDYYYDLAISHASNGMNANCSNNTNVFNNIICGGSIVFTYDNILYYPTQTSLNYGPYIEDANSYYTFGCLTVNDVDFNKQYNGKCNNYMGPFQMKMVWNIVLIIVGVCMILVGISVCVIYNKMKKQIEKPKEMLIQTLQIYNIINNQWSYGTSIPANGIQLNGIESAACIADTIQENIYVFGGRDDFTNATKIIFKYNIEKLKTFYLFIQKHIEIYFRFYCFCTVIIG